MQNSSARNTEFIPKTQKQRFYSFFSEGQKRCFYNVLICCLIAAKWVLIRRILKAYDEQMGLRWTLVFRYQIYAHFYAQMTWNCVILYGTLCLRNFRKHSNHAGLRIYMKVYGCMKKVGLQRYLISSIKPSFFECSHDVNSYLISIAYSPCACKKILWFTWESFFKICCG